MTSKFSSQEETGSIKLPDHKLPSDFMDVQPKTYDADYISDISSKMQVPDRIAVASGSTNSQSQNGLADHGATYGGMSVPDKIVLAGDNQHIGMRQDFKLDLATSEPSGTDSLSFVGLITPPRTLTLDEAFPVVEDNDPKAEAKAAMSGEGEGGPDKFLAAGAANGHVGNVPVPYDPSVANLSDSMMALEGDEAVFLRSQVVRLTRRVQVIEQDNQARFQRDLVMYPLILGYFFWKLLGFFARDR